MEVHRGAFRTVQQETLYWRNEAMSPGSKLGDIFRHSILTELLHTAGWLHDAFSDYFYMLVSVLIVALVLQGKLNSRNCSLAETMLIKGKVFILAVVLWKYQCCPRYIHSDISSIEFNGSCFHLRGYGIAAYIIQISLLLCSTSLSLVALLQVPQINKERYVAEKREPPSRVMVSYMCSIFYRVVQQVSTILSINDFFPMGKNSLFFCLYVSAAFSSG